MEFTTGARLEIRITPADVGKRVSVRRLTDACEGDARFTDAVGVLTSWDAGELRLTRRNGEVVRIPEAAVVAAKAVPAAPARRRGPAATAAELTRVAARGWPPVESERLGDWTLRASAGFTSRANSVLPLGGPGLPLDAALARVTRWYGERGLPALVQVATGAAGTAEPLAAELDARGWTVRRSALMQVGELAPVADRGEAGRVELSRTTSAAWFSLYNRAAELTPAARTVLEGGPSVWFATVRDPSGADSSGTPAAIGRCVVDGRWAGFAAVEVAPAHRRRGLATAVMAALATRALEEGASAAYLQVEPENTAALALYDALGFTTHHSYHYRRHPTP
ncbi:GNAT family N-acetyltransferase [Streptomyces sp. WAC 06738]|uniref:GNAT family N-acetyltransferase n=1 Tax=Streptomyces sp. WAC 06738 TaxID=2203210 RepID=UPI000F71E4E6|nr:GNAT family N-acetyltransferase [Streptomyces sp. WAC 06738]AZM48472.1 GNAT family N-acetyltransferase [Streptomyces sp. WAC 06738]